MTERGLAFLHLSDIHFSKRHLTHYDLDRDVRDQLEADAILVRKELNVFTGILVTGDIAFSGQPHEYETAKTWLTTLCGQLGCEAESVWLTPGNHDVDRGIIARSLLIRDLHQRLRARNPAEVDREIESLFADEEAFEIIHRPFANYNSFASGYGCSVGSQHLHWEQDLDLEDGSTLRLRGVNSALISSERDDDSANRLVVGTSQSLPPKRPDVTYLMLCHHPPDWVWDRDVFNDNLKARVAISLFGHKHVQRIERVNDTLRIGAGAVQPSRAEGWLPRYNFVCLSIDATAADRKLRVEILPRIWNDRDKRFGPEFDSAGSNRVTHELALEPSPRASNVPASAAARRRRRTVAAVESKSGSRPSHEASVMNPERRLTYRFFDLPYTRRMEVVARLELISEQDEGLREDQRYRLYFQRAKDKDLLERFWEEVENLHPDGRPAENPFRRR